MVRQVGIMVPVKVGMGQRHGRGDARCMQFPAQLHLRHNQFPAPSLAPAPSSERQWKGTQHPGPGCINLGVWKR